MSDSVRPHRRQPTRLLHPWDSPGKNIGVGCHFLLQCMKVNGVAKSPIQLSDFTFPDSSVKNPPAMQETPVRFLGQEDPLEKG